MKLRKKAKQAEHMKLHQVDLLRRNRLYASPEILPINNGLPLLIGSIE